MSLQQPSAFDPFMGQLCPFRLVAIRASYHDIANIITAAPAEGNYMIRMPFPDYFLSTVIAATLLPFILLHFLLCGMETDSLSFSGASSLRCHSSNFAPACCFTILGIVAAIFAAVILMPFAIFSSSIFYVKLPIPGSFFPDFIGIGIGPTPLIIPYLLLMGLYILFLVVLEATPAFAIQVILAAFIRGEIFDGWQEADTTLRAVFKRIGDIQHCNLLSSRLGIEVGAAPRNAVVERVITPFQAQLNYTIGATI